MRACQLAGPALDVMRQDEIRNSDASGIWALIVTAEMFQWSSGEATEETDLIEQQAWFAKHRHDMTCSPRPKWCQDFGGGWIIGTT